MSLDWLAGAPRPIPTHTPLVHWDYDAPVTGLVFSRPGGYLAAALGDGTLRIAHPGERRAAPTAVAVHEGAVLTLRRDLAADGFLSGGDDGQLVQTMADGAGRTLLHLRGQFIDTIAVAETLRAVALGREVRLLGADGSELRPHRQPPEQRLRTGLQSQGKTTGRVAL